MMKYKRNDKILSKEAHDMIVVSQADGNSSWEKIVYVNIESPCFFEDHSCNGVG